VEFRGLFVRVGDGVVEAPPEDVAVALRYPDWPEKGPLVDGRRVTIMTAARRCAPGQAVRVLHVVEVVEASRDVYVMGPKPVYGEYVDGRLSTAPPPPGEDPLEPADYDGEVAPGPAVDFNYAITSYVFDARGEHTIEWRPGALASNVLTVTVSH